MCEHAYHGVVWGASAGMQLILAGGSCPDDQEHSMQLLVLQQHATCTFSLMVYYCNMIECIFAYCAAGMVHVVLTTCCGHPLLVCVQA